MANDAHMRETQKRIKRVQSHSLEDQLRSVGSVLTTPDPLRERTGAAIASLADWVDTTTRTTQSLREDLAAATERLRKEILSSEQILAREVASREKLAGEVSTDRTKISELVRQLIETNAAQRSSEKSTLALQERVDNLEDTREAFVQRIARELRAFRSDIQAEKTVAQRIAEEKAAGGKGTKSGPKALAEDGGMLCINSAAAMEGARPIGYFLPRPALDEVAGISMILYL